MACQFTALLFSKYHYIKVAWIDRLLDPFDKIEMLYVEQTEDILPGYFEDILKSVDKP